MVCRWTPHPGNDAQCVGSREVETRERVLMHSGQVVPGIVFRCTVDTRHQAGVAACCAGPSRAMDGAW
ncbi:MAG: hypothetical protein NT024_13210, partial [Proteobacteria bacterium]|nr:hypothetical protein [Pseudomonadota bacterium]